MPPPRNLHRHLDRPSQFQVAPWHTACIVRHLYKKKKSIKVSPKKTVFIILKTQPFIPVQETLPVTLSILFLSKTTIRSPDHVWPPKQIVYCKVPRHWVKHYKWQEFLIMATREPAFFRDKTLYSLSVRMYKV